MYVRFYAPKGFICWDAKMKFDEAPTLYETLTDFPCEVIGTIFTHKVSKLQSLINDYGDTDVSIVVDLQAYNNIEYSYVDCDNDELLISCTDLDIQL